MPCRPSFPPVIGPALDLNCLAAVLAALKRFSTVFKSLLRSRYSLLVSAT